MLVYAIVTVTGLAGLLGAPWWAAVAGACLLILALAITHGSEPVLTRDGAISVGMTRILVSIFNGAWGAAFAFVAGRASAALWGL